MTSETHEHGWLTTLAATAVVVGLATLGDGAPTRMPPPGVRFVPRADERRAPAAVVKAALPGEELAPPDAVPAHAHPVR